MLLLREMDFQVTFIPEDNFHNIPEYTSALQRAGIEVLYAPYTTNVDQHLHECGERYDLVLVFRQGVFERQIAVIRRYCVDAKVLFHTVDLHFLRMSREAELLADPEKQAAAEAMKQREFSSMRASDATIVHSTAELDLLRMELPDAKVYLYPLIMDVPGTKTSFNERRDVVFVGGYQHVPNVDAVKYFVAEIMPLLRPMLPGIKFYVVGSNPPDDILNLACDDVVVLGFIDELMTLLDKMRVSVAPLRYGAGIKGKVGTAMAAGLPVVVTPLAAEGMSLTDGENILIAEGAEQFAEAVATIYRNEPLWNRLSRNGIDFAENAWGAEAAWRILSNMVSDFGMPTSRGSAPLFLNGARCLETEIIPLVDKLRPIASARDRDQFESAMNSEVFAELRSLQDALVQSVRSERFTVDGFCIPCSRNVSLLVDIESGGQQAGDSWHPNWRERLVCPLCGMNNRQRLMAALVKQKLGNESCKSVYFMEQVTAIYKWAENVFQDREIVGSEYLGYEYKGGDVIQGVRHEDVENLSFADESLDLIVSNDVFEHVPHPAKAFSQCARVLKEGGIMLASIPFHRNHDASQARAILKEGEVTHLQSPSYHGNPVSADGALVFTDFGWDLLDQIKASGFSDVIVNIYADKKFGHLGEGQIIFEARR